MCNLGYIFTLFLFPSWHNQAGVSLDCSCSVLQTVKLVCRPVAGGGAGGA